ncbi:MAG: hypothetical protein WEF50_07320 [Myxococcota bacterium]
MSVEDECYYLREYTSGKGFGHGETNSLISNLKKETSRRGRPEWRYKLAAIRQVTDEFRSVLPGSLLQRFAVVPIPPSKAKVDPDYDDRITKIAAGICAEPDRDMRELLETSTSTQPVHAGGSRHPQVIEANLVLNEMLTSPEPRGIILLDDVLVTGSHFVAAKRVLRERFPRLRVIGLFVARRAIPDVELELGE